MNPVCRRSGFTLVELLVVIAIIGVLLGMLLPAVQSAREAARRTACGNNVRQLAIAATLHESQRGFFPSGGWGYEWTGDPDRGFGKSQPGSWIYSLLPNLEYLDVFTLGLDGQPDTITPTQKVGAATAAAIAIPMLNCPSRRPSAPYPVLYSANPQSFRNSDPFSRSGKSDYAANAGSFRLQWGSGPPSMAAALAGAFADKSASNGLSHQRSEIKSSMVTDGLSKTYLVGEKYLDPNSHMTGTSWRDDQGMFHGDDQDVHGWTLVRPLMDRRGFDGFIEFGSSHPLGLAMAFADGSVRIVNYEVDGTVHAFAGSRSDGQVVDSP